MVQGNATLILDLGNSETRGRVQYGRDGNGVIRERAFTLSNRFQIVDPDYKVIGDYSPETSTVFDIDAVVDDKRQIGRWVNGEIQEKEFFTGVLKPSAIDKKYKTLTTALTYHVAIFRALKEIAHIEGISDLTQLDITWTVVLLLPAGDLTAGKSVLEDLIRSVKKVSCSFPEFSAPIKVSAVHVLPEGFCAYMAVLFDRGNVIRKSYEYLAEKETTLVIDIGAGTSDLIVIEGLHSLNSTMTTINFGGNNVTAKVKTKLMETYNIRPTDANMTEAMTTCTIRDGARYIDISDYINKAKSEVARSIVGDIITFFEDTSFPIKNISRILVCGGGSLSGGDNTKVKPMSDIVVEAFKQRSSYVEMIELPEVVTLVPDKDGVTSKVKTRLNPRELNIIGASILAEKWS